MLNVPALRQESPIWDRFCVWAERMGMGFHPDTRGVDYVEADGSRSLTSKEAAQYDADMDAAFRESDIDLYEVAVWMMEPHLTLEQFRASRRWSEDLSKDVDVFDEGIKGWVYLNALFIEQRPAAGWDNGNPNIKSGEWYLIIANCDWISDDLADLEVKLYEFALEEGYDIPPV